jgi:hypothetical protein
MIDQQLIIDAAYEEIALRRCGVTKQLLAIHEVVYEDDKPKVLRVDIEREDGRAIVYFPIKGEKFYLAAYVERRGDKLEAICYTEAYHGVAFKAFSDTLSLEEISALTRLTPTRGWTKGGKRLYKSSLPATNTCAIFEPNPEPDEFEDKIAKLLDYLETDKEGVAAIVEKAEGYIQVASIFHNGNIDGYNLSKEVIRRASLLNLEIDFDLYAQGNFFRD